MRQGSMRHGPHSGTIGKCEGVSIAFRYLSICPYDRKRALNQKMMKTEGNAGYFLTKVVKKAAKKLPKREKLKNF